MGGKPDWMYNEERRHIENTLKERWKDGKWTDFVRDIAKATWVGIKKDDVFPEVPADVEEALCFDDDLFDKDCTVWVRIYQDGQWSKAYRFVGEPVPFIPKGD